MGETAVPKSAVRRQSPLALSHPTLTGSSQLTDPEIERFDRRQLDDDAVKKAGILVFGNDKLSTNKTFLGPLVTHRPRSGWWVVGVGLNQGRRGGVPVAGSGKEGGGGVEREGAIHVLSNHHCRRREYI